MSINIIVLSVLSLIEATQVLIILVLIYSFIPIPVPAFVQKLFPLSLYDVHLERETLFYHCWILVAMGLQGLLIYVFRGRFKANNFWRSLCPYIGTMTIFVGIQIFAVFKILLWGNPAWARGLLYASIGAAVLLRVFWPEVGRIMLQVWGKVKDRPMPFWAVSMADAGVILILLFLIFTPDISKVLARMFSYDKFYHFDSFIMSPAWGCHHGLTLNKDINSEYSLMIPIVFNGLMKLTGGFNYAHAVKLMIALSALYYCLLYGLLRYWLGSVTLSACAIFLCLKLQFFHWGIVPLIWIYPSVTPLRFLPDVFFLFFVLRFTQRFNWRWLAAAAAVNGLSLAWTMDVGVYMYLSLLTAGAFVVYTKGRQAFIAMAGLLFLPWLIMGGVLSIFYGPLLLTGAFWQNTFEFSSLFLQGWGALPITEGLKDKQFFAFCMGFVIPLSYLGCLLYSWGMVFLRQSRRHLFIALACVYGLGLYHYFIHRSGVTSYYAVVVPFIFVVLFGIQAVVQLVSSHWQRGIRMALCLWALMALVTSYLFAYYPNALNLSGYNWSDEKKFYAANLDFSKDALLIDALTGPQEPVAIISSFETKILMQANRKPYFYYFPMMESEHMQGDKLRDLYLHTYARLARTLEQLKDEKPAYIFIQTRLWQGPEAKAYGSNREGFRQLKAFIQGHYRAQAQGQYLTALTLI